MKHEYLFFEKIKYVNDDHNMECKWLELHTTVTPQTVTALLCHHTVTMTLSHYTPLHVQSATFDHHYEEGTSLRIITAEGGTPGIQIFLKFTQFLGNI